MSILNSRCSRAPKSSFDVLDRLVNCLMVFFVIYAFFGWFSHRFLLGHDHQQELCLEGNHRWYLIDQSQRDPRLGDLMAYRSDERMNPNFPLGTLVVKRVEGLSGDLVDLEPQGLRIQGEPHPIRYPHRSGLGARALPLASHIVVPEGGVWVMGDHPRSFDSRYFGAIEAHQIVGLAYALPF